MVVLSLIIQLWIFCCGVVIAACTLGRPAVLAAIMMPLFALSFIALRVIL